MAKVDIKWNASAMRKLEREISSKLADESMEYTCIGCGAVFRPSEGKIVCPSCGLEYRPKQ